MTVGNLPADATEQALIAEFSSVGAVSSFRITHDRETGQAKGFGMCTFLDSDTAALAVRRMNRSLFRGRTLRVALAEESEMDAKPALDLALGPKPLTAQDHVSIVESSVDLLTHQERVELLAQIKIFAQQNPHHAHALLLQNPQLAHMLLHLEVLFDLVQTTDIAQVTAMQQHQHAAPLAAPPPPMYAPPPPMPQQLEQSPPQLSAAQQQQLQFFLSLPPAELAKLPAAVQEQVRMLRAAAKR